MQKCELSYSCLRETAHLTDHIHKIKLYTPNHSSHTFSTGYLFTKTCISSQRLRSLISKMMLLPVMMMMTMMMMIKMGILLFCCAARYASSYCHSKLGHYVLHTLQTNCNCKKGRKECGTCKTGRGYSCATLSLSPQPEIQEGPEISEND